MKLGQTPIVLASVTSSRLVFTDEFAESIRSSVRATAYSEEIVQLSEQQGTIGPDNALIRSRLYVHHRCTEMISFRPASILARALRRG